MITEFYAEHNHNWKVISSEIVSANYCFEKCQECGKLRYRIYAKTATEQDIYIYVHNIKNSGTQ